jgi:GNAT superfamily N-acetyltransferase
MSTPPANFTIRVATESDILALNALIESSIRGLQTNDYTPAQIEGAIGTALGLDTQLIADRTYFLVEHFPQPAELADAATSASQAKGLPLPPRPVVPLRLAGCGGWSYRKTLFGADKASIREPELLNPKTDAAKIRAIFIHPDYARQGLGSLILAHVEAAATAAGFHHFEMGSTLTGIALYKRKGYIPGELVQVPLPNGESLPILKMNKIPLSNPIP